MAVGELRPDPVARRLLPFTFLCLGMAILVSRLPLVLLGNLWTEDGAVFYAEAYNLGSLHALLMPHTGYLQTLPRLEAALAVHFPVMWAPFMATGVSLVFDVLPAAFFLSDRFRQVAPAWMRLLIGLISLVLPGTFELNGNLANVQWHLALLGFLLLVGLPPRRWWGHAIDLAGLALVGLSGPFCVLLTPIALWQWWRSKARWLLARVAVLVAVTGLQLFVLLTHWNQRGTNFAAVNPSPIRFVKILDRVFLDPLLGDHNYEALIRMPIWRDWLPMLTLALGALIIGYALWRGPNALRLFLALAAGVMAETLVSSAAWIEDGQWAGLIASAIWWSPGGARYFYIPALAWVLTLIWLAARGWRPLRIPALLLLACGLIAVPQDWRYPELPASGFRAAAQRFDAAPRGTSMTLPIEIAPFWTMELRKR